MITNNTIDNWYSFVPVDAMIALCRKANIDPTMYETPKNIKYLDQVPVFNFNPTHVLIWILHPIKSGLVI